MRWLELSVAADIEAVEAVSEILGRVSAGTAVHPSALIRDPKDELAASPDPTAPFVVTAHIEAGPGAAARITETERALWHLQAFGLRPVGELTVRDVDDGDWIERWRVHYAPQRIGRVVIVPSWVDQEAEPDDVTITLDPGMAFGTGLHPTTRGCLELLQEEMPMPARVLDVGCGSGILSLAAVKLGAGHAVGIDTEVAAVEATITNAERNGLGDRIEARHGTLTEEVIERFPLVMANLVAALLIDLAPRLAAHVAPDGKLLASGIIEPRADDVIEAMVRASLVVRRRLDHDEWVSLVLGHAA